MNIKSFIKMAAALAVAAVAPLATAGTVNSSDAFYNFYSTVTSWTAGGLGTGLATTMLLMGGAIGVAKNSPLPALSGVAGAAFLHWGPTIIQNLMLNGGLI